MPLLALPKVPVPERLCDSTVQAAMLFAARDAAEAGLVSGSAVSLTEGVLHAMLVSKFTTVAAVITTVLGLVAGAAVFARQDPSAPGLPGSGPPATAPPRARAVPSANTAVNRRRRTGPMNLPLTLLN